MPALLRLDVPRLVILVLLVSSPALAAESPLTPEQAALHASGERLGTEGNFAQAAGAFRAALALGEYKLGLYYQGRALRRLGTFESCALAAETLARVKDAPSAGLGPADKLDAAARDDRDTLARQCPGRLEVRCPISVVEFRVQGHPDPFPCNTLATLPAGPVTLDGALFGVGEVVGAETRTLNAQLRATAPPIGLAPAPEPALALPSLAANPVVTPPVESDTLGWVVVGTGGALLVSALVLEGVRSDALDEANTRAADYRAGRVGIGSAREAANDHSTLRAWNIGAWVLGAVVSGVGAGLLVF